MGMGKAKTEAKPLTAVEMQRGVCHIAPPTTMLVNAENI
jgi:hypothetical protein